MYLAELNSRGREVAPALSGSSMMFYQVRDAMLCDVMLGSA
jgi:hypothetical protein